MHSSAISTSLRRAVNAPLVLSLVIAVGCGSSVHDGGGTVPEPEFSIETAAQYREAEQRYHRMPDDAGERRVVRDALIFYRSSDLDGVLEAGDYDAVVTRLQELAEYLRPADMVEGAFPAPLLRLARWVVEHGSPRGDEGHVMAAQLLLAFSGDEPQLRRAERERIAEWGRWARQNTDNPLERFATFVEVWEEHERITPSPEVLATLADVYIAQRDALAGLMGPEGRAQLVGGRMDIRQLQLAPQLVQRAPLQVAAVYLRHGDVSEAVSRVRSMSDGSSALEERLLNLLQQAESGGEQGAEALAALGEAFLSARPLVAKGICRHGLRSFPNDARFCVCLARAAVEEGHIDLGTSWYREAVRIDAGERAIYDEALAQVAESFEPGSFHGRIDGARVVLGNALEILTERESRWADSPPPVSRAQVLLAWGIAERDEGNLDEAQQRIEASLELQESSQAHDALGFLLERTGDFRGALQHYRNALDSTGAGTFEQTARRAALTQRLGDAFRRLGDDAQAARMYRQALDLWAEHRGAIQGPPDAVAMVEVAQGVLYSRLGQNERMVQSFENAMGRGATTRGPYATMLAHLVVGEPNLPLAEEVFHRAQYQLSLEPMWKVYFALWVQAIASRSEGHPGGDALGVLSTQTSSRAWSARLAAFGLGEIDFEALVGEASDRGQITEAHFYEGARLLGEGDAAGARTHFQEVLDQRMVNFYEHTMALELLAELPTGGQTGAVAAE